MAPSRRRLALLALALLFTLLNAVKPLHVDDTAYFFFARQIGQHPFDPYGFDLFWYDRPEPAFEILAPPVLLYYLAPAVRLFPGQPWLWKLWLLPFALLLVAALHALFRRFAHGLEMSLTWMTVLSPALLPSFNLMLDVPALALYLAAVAVFLCACDRESLRLVLLAGLLAGLAMQTKYTGGLAVAAIGLAALLYRRWQFGAAAIDRALLIFVGCELLLVYLYGQSHFLFHLRAAPMPLNEKVRMALPLMTILGGLVPGAALLGLASLGGPQRDATITGLITWLVSVAGGLLVLGLVLIMVIPAEDAVFSYDATGEHERLTLTNTTFGSYGLLVVALGVVTAGRLLLLHRHGQHLRTSWFLVLWAGAEVLGCFALTPFTAARRLLGVVVVVTLLVGRLAARTCRDTPRRRLVWSAALVQIGLGLLFYSVDLREAFVHRQGAIDAQRWIREQPAGATIWYAGHWGFQYQCEHLGMRPVIPWSSRLQPGDWLVVPDGNIHRQGFEVGDWAEPMVHVVFEDSLPLRTIWCYYSGSTALEHAEGPRLVVTIYRIRWAVVPRP